jgi:uncharacterized protein
MGTSVTKTGTEAPRGLEPRDRVAEALFGRTKRNLLTLLFGASPESFYLRQMVRETGTGSGAVQRELAQLVDAGLVERLPQGSQVYYRANRQSPVYAELRSLVAKTAGIAGILRLALAPFIARNLIDVAFVYGSVAKGDHGPRSDIDLMVIGDVTLSELLPALKPAQERLGREVTPSVYRAADFSAQVKKGSHFLKSVASRPKIMIIGSADDVARLGR